MSRARKIRGIDFGKQTAVVLPLILKTRFREMLSFEKILLEKKDAEAIHDFRVAARRVQAILKIFHSFYTENLYRKNYHRLKSLIRALGEARQTDVYIDVIKKYGVTVKGQDKKAIDRLLKQQKAIRKQKIKSVIELINKLNNKGFKDQFAELYS